MVDFLSPAWIEAADASLAAAKISAPDPIVVQHVVVGDAGSMVTFHVAVDPDGGRVLPGSHENPTVTYRSGSATAAGIAAGELDPYAEFMAGRLEISGNTSALADRQDLIESLQTAFSRVLEA